MYERCPTVSQKYDLFVLVKVNDNAITPSVRSIVFVSKNLPRALSSNFFLFLASLFLLKYLTRYFVKTLHCEPTLFLI